MLRGSLARRPSAGWVARIALTSFSCGNSRDSPTEPGEPNPPPPPSIGKPATDLEIVSGNGQTGPVADRPPVTLSLTVRDNAGNPISGADLAAGGAERRTREPVDLHTLLEAQVLVERRRRNLVRSGPRRCGSDGPC